MSKYFNSLDQRYFTDCENKNAEPILKDCDPIRFCTVHREYESLSRERKTKGLIMLKEWVDNELNKLK